MAIKQDTYIKESGPTLVYDRGIRKGFAKDIAANHILNGSLNLLVTGTYPRYFGLTSNIKVDLQVLLTKPGERTLPLPGIKFIQENAYLYKIVLVS